MAARALIAGGLSIAALAGAPLQCGSREAEEPALRREETAGDALWALAADFRSKGDESAAQRTLRYLVENYPSSRYAGAAKEQLRPDASTR